MRARRLTAALVMSGLLAAAPAALAGTVSNSGGFVAAPGERNDVTVRVIGSGAGGATVADLGAPLIVGEGCTAGTPVFCTGYPVVLRLGDRADRGDIRGNWRPQGIVYGEGGADVIHSDGLEAFAYGGTGPDEIRLTAHSGTAYGGPGADTIFGDAEVNRLVGEGGNDHIEQRLYGITTSTLDGGPGDDTIAGYVGGRLFGGAGDDAIWTSGGSLKFTIDAGGGNDLVVGGGDGDAIDSGPGADFVQAAADGEADTVVCGTGRDTVRADPLDTVATDCERVTVVGS